MFLKILVDIKITHSSLMCNIFISIIVEIILVLIKPPPTRPLHRLYNICIYTCPIDIYMYTTRPHHYTLCN